MKTRYLLQALPLLALTHFATAQQPLPPPSPDSLPAAVEVAAPQTLTINFPGGPLQDAVGAVQDALERAKAEPVNVVISISKDQPAFVPALVLRNVTGPDALMLIATAAGVEFRPVSKPGESRVIGWELAPGPRAFGGGTAFTTPPTPTSAPAPVVYTAPPALIAQPLTSPSVATPGVPSSATIVGGSANGLPMLSSVPGVGHVFTATALEPPRLEGATNFAGGGGLQAATGTGGDVVVATVAENSRETRVYALGSLVWYAPFPDIEKTLREMLETDGFKPGDIKLSFHEKTNVLVANGAPRAHQLIDQLIQALSRDASVRQAENQSTESRNLRDELARQTTSLKEAEEHIQELRKAADAAQAARAKAEADMKAFKNQPKPIQQ